MADVNVEFGATDTGLQKTLETIQQQMTSLQGEVDSGTLSFQEINQKMRELKQAEGIFTKLGGEISGAGNDIKKFGDDIDSAKSKAQSIGGIFDAEFNKIAGAFTAGNLAAEGFQKIISVAFDAAQAVVQGFSDALDLGGRLNELSSRTGETAGKLLVLETAFKNSGLQADQVGTAINKLQNFMQDAANGGEKQRAAMQSLGVSMSDLAGKTPTEQMQVFADKIAGIEDPTARAAAASEVFGDKLGGKLLPLFSDFSGNLEDARAKVGSLEQVMDENAATFDAAAETFDAVKSKVMAFAAGVLSEALPALKDFGEWMAKVDAAELGKQIGDFLAPRIEKLGYTIIGVVEDFKQFIDILQKLTGEGTALGKFIDRIIEFNTAMQDTVNFISPMDDLFNAFEQKGRAAADAQKELSAKTDNAAESLKSSGTAAQDATGKLDNLGTSAQDTAQNIDGVFSLGSDFAPKLDGISGSWGGVNDQILTGKDLLGENISLTESMTGSVEEQFQALGGVNESMESILASEKQSEESKKVSKALAELIDKTYGSHADKLKDIQAKQDALAAKEKERKDRLKEGLDFELKIAEAKARGDEELVKTLENQKLFNAELKKAIDAGMGAPQAREFANRMIQAKNAVESIGNRDVSVSVTTKVNRAEYDELMASINAGVKDPKTLEILFKTTGKTDFDEAYKTLQNMQAINKNFDVALKVSGAESLEEVWQNLNSIPTTKQIQLGMEITGKDTYDEVIRSLPTFAGTKTAKLLLEQQGFENMTSFINTLKGVPDEKRVKLIAEALGTADVNAAKAALDQVLANDGKKATVSVGADTSEVDQKLQSVRQSTELPLEFMTEADVSAVMSEIDRVKEAALQPLTLNLEGDASNVTAKVKDFEGDPINFSLEADDTAASKKIDALGADPITLSLGADTANAQEKIKELESEKLEIPTTIKIDRADFSAQLKDIQTEMNNSFSGGTGGSGGSGGEGGQGGAGGNATADIGTLQKVVETIKNLVEKIEPKLPTHALA